jgi:hypothetical protein
VFAIAEDRIKPIRMEKDPVKYPRMVLEWWKYWNPRLAMLHAIADLDRVLVIARHSKTGLPLFVNTGQVMSDATVIFSTDRAAMLSLLSSSMHFIWWTTKGESTLETRLRYTPSDGFETFPQPQVTGRMERAGDHLDTFRRTEMEIRRIGLTDFYNLADNNAVDDGAIARLRQIHVEIDEAVQEAYSLDEEREPGIRAYEATAASAPLPGWRDIELGHGFHETRQGVRFTISAQARADVLDKLLALNHYRYEQEVKRGLHSGKGRGGSRKKGGGHIPPIAAPAFDDGGLFPPARTMF